jgi:hypothetical protein
MPSYKFDEMKETFRKFVSEHKELGRKAVIKFYNSIPDKEPTLQTLYNWYDVISGEDGKGKKYK